MMPKEMPNLPNQFSHVVELPRALSEKLNAQIRRVEDAMATVIRPRKNFLIEDISSLQDCNSSLLRYSVFFWALCCWQKIDFHMFASIEVLLLVISYRTTSFASSHPLQINTGTALWRRRTFDECWTCPGEEPVETWYGPSFKPPSSVWIDEVASTKIGAFSARSSTWPAKRLASIMLGIDGSWSLGIITSWKLANAWVKVAKVNKFQVSIRKVVLPHNHMSDLPVNIRQLVE